MSSRCEEWDSWGVEEQCDSRIRDRDGEYHRCQQMDGPRHRGQHSHSHGPRAAVTWPYDLSNPGAYYGRDAGVWMQL